MTEVASPLMIGALTVMIATVAVFLSYNAGSGLPFVPTYSVFVEVPDTQELVPNNEVVVSGRRVGVIHAISAETTEEGRPYARMSLKLDPEMDGQLLSDATVRVRARSLLGAKYLELIPGTNGEPLEFGEVLPLDRARVNVEVDEVVDELDAPTRRDLAVVLDGFGTGFAGRGTDLNAFLEELAPLLRNAQPVLADLAAPATGFERLITTFAATQAELGPVADDVGVILEAGAATLGALEAAGPELEETIEELPATLESGTESLHVLGPVLGKARALTARLSPGARLLPSTVGRLASAAEAGTPVIRRARVLGPLLDDAFVQVRGLAVDEPTVPALDSLAGVLPELRPAVEHLAPYQTVCNYIAIASRNMASTVAEGSPSGNWLRFDAILNLDQMLPAAEAAPDLHFNPYPNGAAPGQPRECEGGRETYMPGQLLGNVPGNQGLATELTTPESVAAVSD